MDGRSQRTPALIAAASAVVLILSLFLDWYRLDLPERVAGREIDVPTYNAFEGLERADVAILLAAVVALILAGLLLARMLASSPLPGVGLLGVGLFALAVVVYRGASAPARLVFGEEVDSTLRFGWYLSVVCAASIAVFGLLAYLAGPRLQLELDEDEDEDEGPGAEPRGERA
jgi:hypothetical protein